MGAAQTLRNAGLRRTRARETVLELIKRCQIFVLPCVIAPDGDRDGIPVLLMEAMACEKAALSTELAGITELIENNKSGVLVRPGDEKGLADAIAILIKDRALCHKLGKEGRKKVVKEFDISVTCAKKKELFIALCRG